MKLAASFSVALLACGAAPVAVPPAPVSTTTPTPVTAPAKPADGPTVVTYTRLSRGWVEEKMVVDPAAAKAWAADPANAKLVLPSTRHILVKIDPKRSDATEAAAKKRAEALLARVRRGEDFAAIARAESEDPGSRDNGGMYPGQMVEMFVEPYVVAYKSLAPGEVTKKLVRTQFGFHIIKKEIVDDASIALAYRRAEAPKVTRRLAGDIAERLRAPHAEAHARREIDAALDAAFGGKCACEDDRPPLVVVPVDKVTSKTAPACAKIVATPRGESRILEIFDGVLVTKAGDRADVDELVKADLDAAPEHARWGACTPTTGDAPEGAELTPEQIRRLLEEMQRKKGSGR